jgi:DNA-binding protein Fis
VWMGHFESLYAQAVLRRAGGNVTRAAVLAGVNRRSLQRMLAKIEGGEPPEGDDTD